MVQPTEIDIAVVGLGAMGSATLWRLAARGARAVGFEQFAPGHDQGSSHGEARIIRSAYFEDPRYVPLVARAFALWETLEAESGVPLLTRTGALMIGAPESTLIQGTLASARAHGLAYERLDAAALARRYPQHHLNPGEVGVYEDPAGILRPEAGVRAAVAAAERLGATVWRHTPVTRLEATAAGVRLEAGGTVYRARQAVVAVGPWLGAFLPDLRLPLQVERQVQFWFPLRDAALYDPARCPVYIHEPRPDHYCYGFPTQDGATVKVAIHHAGTITTAQDVDRTVHPADVQPVADFVRAHLAGVAPEPVRATVCLYTNTPDSHFLVDPVPGLPRVTLLGGFSGHGFKFAPVLGDAVADLLLTGTTAYPIGFFALDRFAAG